MLYVHILDLLSLWVIYLTINTQRYLTGNLGKFGDF